MDCPKGEKMTVELLSGIAEIFGTEMVTHTKYSFSTGKIFLSGSIPLIELVLKFESCGRVPPVFADLLILI